MPNLAARGGGVQLMGQRVKLKHKEQPQAQGKTFSYPKLSKARHEIRLCTLHPGTIDDILTCTLNTVSLKDRPDYETPPNVWGDPTRNEQITANGSFMSQVMNCIACLEVPGSMGNGLLIYMMVMDARQRNEANRAISIGKRHTDCPTLHQDNHESAYLTAASSEMRSGSRHLGRRCLHQPSRCRRAIVSGRYDGGISTKRLGSFKFGLVKLKR